jgi:hypothetical protein
MILKVLDLVMGLRVSEEEELAGLDVSQHGERAYAAPLGLLSTLAAATPSVERISFSPAPSTAWEEGGGQHLARQAALGQESPQRRPT